MAITLRNTKGSALTHTELDGNFTDLDGRVLDSDGIRALIDSDYVQLRTTAHYTGFDSDFGTKSTTNLAEGNNLYYTTARHDSDALALIDSAYVEARISAHYNTNDFDSDFAAKTTAFLAEGDNLYYTTARHDSDTLVLVDSAYVQLRETAQDFAYSSLTGTPTILDSANVSGIISATTLAYSTDSATLWDGTPPTTIDSALDRIALVVRSLNGGTGA